MKKSICCFITLILLLSVVPAGAQELPELWQSDSFEVLEGQNFDMMSNSVITFDGVDYWRNQTAGPQISWQAGQLYLGQTELQSNFAFRLGPEQALPAASVQNASGIGFYIENNTDTTQYVGFYMVGTGLLAAAQNKPIYKIDAYGNMTSNTQYSGGRTQAVLSPGFKGYIMLRYQDAINLWTGNNFDFTSHSISWPGFEFFDLQIGQNESIIIDSVFFFKENNQIPGENECSHIDADNDNHVISGSIVCQNASSASDWQNTVTSTGSYDLLSNFYSMYQPEVVYVSEWDVQGGYPYLMWFGGWAYTQENTSLPAELYPGYPGYPGYDGGDAIFMARAQSLEGPWQVYSRNYENDQYYWDDQMSSYNWCPIMTCGNSWYDNWHVNDPSVVYQNGRFYMAYSAMGTDTNGVAGHLENVQTPNPDGQASCIMGAVSVDGIHWVRSSAPLMIWTYEAGYNETQNSDGYMGGYQRPSIMYENGKWRMWFDYKYNRLGYAECTGDFMTPESWELKQCQDINGMTIWAVDFDVAKVGDIYYAYGDPYLYWYDNIYSDKYAALELEVYENKDPDHWRMRQLVEYQSYDGITWIPTGFFLPDTIPNNDYGYGANQVPQIFLDHENDRVCIFYATQRGLSGGAQEYDWTWSNFRMIYKDIQLFG